MRSAWPLLAGLVLLAGACAESNQGPKTSVQGKRDLNSSIAGKTYRCTADGPSTPVTFAKDGQITGELLQTTIKGSWFSRGSEGVEIYVDVGSISIRDVLKQRGGGWSGRNIRCS